MIEYYVRKSGSILRVDYDNLEDSYHFMQPNGTVYTGGMKNKYMISAQIDTLSKLSPLYCKMNGIKMEEIEKTFDKYRRKND